MEDIEFQGNLRRRGWHISLSLHSTLGTVRPGNTGGGMSSYSPGYMEVGWEWPMGRGYGMSLREERSQRDKIMGGERKAKGHGVGDKTALLIVVHSTVDGKVNEWVNRVGSC